MSSDGELYIDENCRDIFEKELDKWFGKDMWRLYGGDFAHYWDVAGFPKIVEVQVKDIETDETIGKVEITTEFDVEEENYGRHIVAIPKSIKLLEIKDELKQIVKEKINKINKKK